MADDESQDSTAADAVQLPSVEVIQTALVNAFRAKGIDVDDDGVKVTDETGLYHLQVRLAGDGTPLPPLPDDMSDIAPGSLKGSAVGIIGAVQFAGTEATRVTMRIDVTETSAIIDAGKGDADGVSEESIGNAAEEALSNMRTLCG